MNQVMNQIVKRSVFYGLFSVAMGAVEARDRDESPYDRFKGCKSYHDSQQYKSWPGTGHGQVMKVLAGEEAEAKEKAGLNSGKDYTEDSDYVSCYVTWYEKKGYESDDSEHLNKFLQGVGCESYREAGYKNADGSTAKEFGNFQDFIPQKDLAEMGQVLIDEGLEERCSGYYLSHIASLWPHAEKPYTSSALKVGRKSKFKFKEAVRNDGAMHKHYKLEVIFSGNPMASFHGEFQKHATPPEE